MNHEQIGKKRSRFKETWRRLKKSRNAMIGLTLIAIIIIAISTSIIFIIIIFIIFS